MPESKEHPQQFGKLVVITGMSGGGKDSLIHMLLSHPDFSFRRIVTHNTRPPRPDEVEGVDYFFVNVEEFSRLSRTGEIIEQVKHGSFLKGTSKAQLEQIFEGVDLIWRIDPSRAASIKEYLIEKLGEKIGQRVYANTIVIFVTVSTKEILRQRYIDRGETDIEEFEIRFNQDQEQFERNRHCYHHILYNDASLEEAFKQMVECLNNND